MQLSPKVAKPTRAAVILICLTSLLGACGQKGDLILPQDTTEESETISHNAREH